MPNSVFSVTLRVRALNIKQQDQVMGVNKTLDNNSSINFRKWLFIKMTKFFKHKLTIRHTNTTVYSDIINSQDIAKFANVP